MKRRIRPLSKPAKVKARGTRPSTLSHTSTSTGAFPIVGIGASAGGLEAFTQLLKHLPLDTGMGFVLVQHLDPQHESALTQLLTRATSMTVREVTNNMPVRSNHVYVIPPNTNLRIAQGVLKLQPRPQTPGAHRSIDFFLEALAQDQRQCAIGVILSGTATDGTMGLEAVKAEGGITFAQDESAKHDSMPRSAIAAGCVDFVLSPENIARELAHIAKHPFVAKTGENVVPCEPARESTRSPEAPAKPDGFRKILLLLRNHCGVDFALYKPSTIERRITRRMVLHKMISLADYAAFLRGNQKELDALYSDVLINVTGFFRNPEAFDLLKSKVFPKLLQQRGNDPFRAWVLACSTGQEAYSLAMALQEFIEYVTHPPKVQIFATDLNTAVLDKARAGFYARALVADVSPERLRRFFVEEQGGYRVAKTLREMIVFAPQNLLTDPPFSRMDLITCRNLLIYLESDLQKKAVPTFHYALKPGGFLFLGASESISGYSDLFEAVDKKHKIYSRKPAPTPPFRLEFPLRATAGKQGAPASKRGPEGQSAEVNTQREADRVTLSRHAPPGLLVNADFQVLEFRGDTSAYLKPPTGRASFNVLKMAREGLLPPLRAALNQAKKENKAVRKDSVRVVQNGLTHTTNVEIVPLKNLKERCYLIFFDRAEKAGRRPAASPMKPTASKSRENARRSRPTVQKVAELQRELAEKDDYLQSVQEQYEAANEELQSSSEEVTSANEELQSINEELETSKEELESTNEELTTVNEEMANRNTELNRLNSDLHNLHASVSLPIVVVARNLTIRRFTPAAHKLFSLVAPDVGRLLSSIRHNLDLSNLEQLLKEVIDTVSVRERETQDKDGRWYSLRARPYLTLDNKIDGAVLVLMDITDLKRSEREAKAARDYAEATIRTVRDPIVVLLADLRVNTANEAFYRTFKATPEQAEGRSIFELCAGALNTPRLRLLLEDILPRNSFFADFEVTHDFPNIGLRRMLLNARRLNRDDGTPMILLGIEDVTERQQLQEAKSLLASIVESSDDSIISIDFDQIITSWNAGAERLYGYPPAEAIGKSLTMLSLPEGLKEALARVDEIKHGAKLRTFEVERKMKDGQHLFVAVTMSLIKDASGLPVGLSTLSRDITARKRAEMNLGLLASVSQDLVRLAHVDEVMRAIGQKIADHLSVSLCVFAEISESVDQAVVTHEWHRDDVPGLAGAYRLSEYVTDAFQKAGRAGQIFVVRDTATDLRTDAQKHAALKIGSLVCVPLLRGGQWKSLFAVHHSHPHDWREDEIVLVRELADRIWARVERLHAEEASRQSEQHFRTLFELGPVAVYSCDASGVIQQFNRRAAELWGRAPAPGDTDEQFCGSDKMFRPDGSFMPHDQCPMAEVVAGKVSAVNDAEVLIERPDGSRVAVVVNIRPLKSEQGEITGAINCFYDITERKQDEEARKSLNHQLAVELAGTQRLQETSTLLIHGGDATQLYEQILEAALAIMRSDMASLQMLDEGRHELRLLASRGFHLKSAAFWERVQVDSGSSCAAALRLGKRVIVPDIETSELMAGRPDLEEYRRSNIRVAQSTPLLSRSGALIGMLSTHWHNPHQPAERELRLLDVLARQAADLIERNQASESLQLAQAQLADRAAQLEELVTERTTSGYNWRTRTFLLHHHP